MKKRTISALLISCTLLAALSGCEASFDIPKSLQSSSEAELTTTTAETEVTTETTTATADSTTLPAATDAPVQTKATTAASAPAKTTTVANQQAAATNAPATQAPANQSTTAAAVKQDNVTFSRTALPADQFSSEFCIVADRIAAIPGEQKVPFRLMLFGNKEGFAMYGIRVSYDSNLPPIFDAESEEVVTTEGAILSGSTSVCAASPEDHLFAYALAGTKEIKQDGTLYTCYFNVPETAKSGDVYKINISLNSMMKTDGTQLNPKLYSGYIVIE